MEIPDLPELEIVETEALHPHEEVDEGRADRLINALRTQGFLKNPPIVLRISRTPERYVVLDGANRTLAVKRMGFPHMLVQVANAGVEVKSWNHILLDGSMDPLLEGARSIAGIRLQTASQESARAAIGERQALAYLAFPSGEYLTLGTEAGGVTDGLEELSVFVRLYEGLYRRERTSVESVNGLSELFPDLRCLIVYPRFQVEDVIQVASSGRLFPSGLTRFLISPRALRVNFPLAMLADRSPVEEKRTLLGEWIRQRVKGRRVRYYGESTFLFDE